MLKTSTVLGVLIVLAVVLVVALSSGVSVASAFIGCPPPPTPLPHERRVFCSGEGVLSADDVASLPPATIGRPCAAVKICSEGEQVVKFSDIPNCPHSLKVMCMNDEGQWVSNTLHNVSTSPDGTSLMFTSDQQGTCAFFPAGANIRVCVD